MKCAQKLFARFFRLDPQNYVKKRLQNMCFPINFVTFLRRYFYRTPRIGAVLKMHVQSF